MKQYEAVLTALEELGGVATLGDLNHTALKISNCEWKTKTPYASIRRIVQQTKGIYKIKPGLWALESHRKELETKGYLVENEKNKNSEEIKKFNHSYYQGLLTTIGNLRGLSTFMPDQDKNKIFSNKTLGQIRTLQEMPNFSYDYFIKKSSTIDVIWFNDRKMPCSFFEVEHSTDIQNSLLKFSELTDFSTRMFIVADSMRRKEYLSKINYSSFQRLTKDKRVLFLSYGDLEKQYAREIEKCSYETIL